MTEQIASTIIDQITSAIKSPGCTLKTNSIINNNSRIPIASVNFLSNGNILIELSLQHYSLFVLKFIFSSNPGTPINFIFCSQNINAGIICTVKQIQRKQKLPFYTVEISPISETLRNKITKKSYERYHSYCLFRWKTHERTT